MTDGVRKPYIAGNWKMNLDRSRALDLIKTIKGRLGDGSEREVAVFVPAVYLADVTAVAQGSPLGVGTQKLESIAIRRGVPCHKHTKAFAAWRIVSKAQEAEERLVSAARLERVQGTPRRLVGHHHGDAGDDREGAALTPEHPRVDARAFANQRFVLDDRDRGAAKGAAQDVQEARVHHLPPPTGIGVPKRSMKTSSREPTSARR